MKKLWEKIKKWAIEIALPWLQKKVKKWAIEIALPWLQKNWMQLINIIVLFIAYGTINEVTQPRASAVIGLWLFLLLGYYIFWKLFGADKIIKRKEK